MSSVLRVGGISYLRIPAEDPRGSASFYEAVFGWSVREDRDDPSFEDGTGHVIGHFVADLSVAGDPPEPQAVSLLAREVREQALHPSRGAGALGVEEDEQGPGVVCHQAQFSRLAARRNGRSSRSWTPLPL